jgi:hypothetical protein
MFCRMDENPLAAAILEACGTITNANGLNLDTNRRQALSKDSFSEISTSQSIA